MKDVDVEIEEKRTRRREEKLNGEKPIKRTDMFNPEFMKELWRRKEERLNGIKPLTALDKKNRLFMEEYRDREKILNGIAPLTLTYKKNLEFMEEYKRREEERLNGIKPLTARDKKNPTFMEEYRKRERERGTFSAPKEDLNEIIMEEEVITCDPSKSGNILLNDPTVIRLYNPREICSLDGSIFSYFSKEDQNQSKTWNNVLLKDKKENYSLLIKLDTNTNNYQFFKRDSQEKWHLLQNIPTACPNGTDPQAFIDVANGMVKFFKDMPPEKVEKYKEHFKAWISHSDEIFTLGSPDKMFDGFMKVADKWEKSLKETPAKTKAQTPKGKEPAKKVAPPVRRTGASR